MRFGWVGCHAEGLSALEALLAACTPITGAITLHSELAEAVAESAIIEQTASCITHYDTCASLYERVAASNRDMLLRVVPRLLAGERPGRLQPAGDEPLLPRRRPADGRIDWGQPARAIYDFIRALTRPYPGAFSWLAGRRWP